MIETDKIELTNIVSKLKDEILLGVQRSINTAFLHQKTFGEFKNKFQGKTVVLVGAGPTLKYYEPVEDAIYIGVNRTFLYESIKFDYLFAIDKNGLETDYESYIQAFLDYKENNCIKFIGDQNCGRDMQIPEGKLNNTIRRYKTTANFVPNRFTLDIDCEPLGNFYSVSFQAMQFILFTNPAKIYLAGMDSNVSIAGHFAGKDNDTIDNKLTANTLTCLTIWKELAEFKNTYYPDTEIISVNPVGLKGIFNDIYTEKYSNSDEKKKFEKAFNEFLNAPMKNYLEKIGFSKQYAKLQKELENKKVIIYGTGTLFQTIQKMYDLSKLNIVALSDKRYISTNAEFLGYKTIPPTKIINYNPDCILVATLEYEEIISDLTSMFSSSKKPKIIPLAKKR